MIDKYAEDCVRNFLTELKKPEVIGVLTVSMINDNDVYHGFEKDRLVEFLTQYFESRNDQTSVR